MTHEEGSLTERPAAFAARVLGVHLMANIILDHRLKAGKAIAPKSGGTR